MLYNVIQRETYTSDYTARNSYTCSSHRPAAPAQLYSYTALYTIHPYSAIQYTRYTSSLWSPHAFLSSSRQQPPTLKLTWSRCTSHSGASKRRGKLMHAPRHCALAVRAGSSSSGGQTRDLGPSTPPRGHGEPWEAGPRPIPTWLRQALSIACVWLPGWSVLVYSCIILRPG